MTELQTEKRFHNLTLEQIQALDQILTEVIPIHGRGNFPTLQLRAKDIIRVVKDRLVEREIQVKDIRLNGTTASHILVRNNGLGYRDLDIIFGVELPRQEDFQVIKDVVLGSLRDLLPCGVNRRKITCLTMKEAYVQKMVKVFNEHDRWSLILLSNNRARTVGLRFVSSLRRQFEFSVDSFQIILDRMLESYWETERKQRDRMTVKAGSLAKTDNEVEKSKEQEQGGVEEGVMEDSAMANATGKSVDEAIAMLEKEPGHMEGAGELKAEQVLDKESRELPTEEEDGIVDVLSEEDTVFELFEETVAERAHCPLAATNKSLFSDAGSLNDNETPIESQASPSETPQEMFKCEEIPVEICNPENLPDISRCEFSFPPPAKKTCSTSQEVVPDYCPSPKLQRKMSRKLISKPENWSLLTDLSDLTTQLFLPIDIPKPLQPKPPLPDVDQCSSEPSMEDCQGTDALASIPLFSPGTTSQGSAIGDDTLEQTVKLKPSKKPPDSGPRTNEPETDSQHQVDKQRPETIDRLSTSGSLAGAASWVPTIAVEAECVYGDFEQALEHLRHRLIATHHPEEIRGGGLLKYSDLLVRNFRPASEMEIKSLERYMCSRFFIDFPDVSEQQRKIETYLQCHFSGSEEASKYDYLMTLRRVIDESTVCLMGHERRQTLNMITVLALRVLGEQNAIPNTANVTCFYQPAPYIAEPMYNSYFITQAQPPLVYHPYPLHVHMQTGLV